MMENGPSQATVVSWSRLMRAQAKALAAVERALKAAGFPPLAWYDVLLELGRKGNPDGLRPKDLQERLLLAQPNVSRLLDRLEAAGLIARARHNQDGRGQVASTTESGRALRERMWPTYAAVLESVIEAKLSESEVQELGCLLKRLIDD